MELSKLKQLLLQVEGSYYNFVVGIMVYAEKKQSRIDAVTSYLTENPGATSSDVVEFVSHQSDFYEDSAREQVV